MNSRRKKVTTGIALVLQMTLVVGVATVFALLTTNNLFELGPGAVTDEGGLTNILGDANPANGPDWADLFNADGSVKDPFGGTPAFIKDDLSFGGNPDNTVYSGGPGDKNSDHIADWTWGTSSVPAKDDITNAYVYAKTDPITNHLILYVGVERRDPNGDSHVDIEFFQNKIALDRNPPCPDGKCKFTGTNKDGDILVNMDFTQGGDFAGLSLRRRHEGVNSNYDLIETLGGEGCTADGVACAFTNAGSIDGGPWPNFGAGGGTITNLPAKVFTEAGIDVTQALGFTPCFSTVQVKTRSSQSFTATLKDFQLQSFQQCVAQARTEIHSGPSVGATHIAPDIQNTTIPRPALVHDKAIVSGNVPGAPTPTGTVTFKRFFNATVPPSCTGPSTDEVVGLTEIAPPTQTTPGIAAAESSTFDAPAGFLSYQAVYSGDLNYTGPVTSPCEPLTVVRETSAVVTDIKEGNINGRSLLNTAVDISAGPVTAVDVATIIGKTGGPDPTGTVTFRRFLSGNCSGSFTDETVTIVADTDPTDGIATAVSGGHLLNTATGSFLSYMVVYNGDGNYGPSAASKCEPLCAFPFVPK